VTRSDLFVPFLSGLLVTGYCVIGLFFLRFWRQSRDSLFGWFASAFFLLAVQRVLIAVWEPSLPLYFARLLAFVLILWAIIEKNRA
jgi:hypothetical protein